MRTNVMYETVLYGDSDQYVPITLIFLMQKLVVECMFVPTHLRNGCMDLDTWNIFT